MLSFSSYNNVHTPYSTSRDREDKDVGYPVAPLFPFQLIIKSMQTSRLQVT